MELLAQYDPAWLAGLAGALVLTGVVAGVLAGLLGVGGGIVIVPVLYHLFTLLELDPAVRMHLAVGTSLATIIPTSIISARAHYRKGGLDPALLRSLGPAVLVGALIGGLAGSAVDGAVLSAVFAVVALLVAANMALRPEGSALAADLPRGVGRAAIGMVIGGLSAIMGIGGGTLSVPVLSAFNYPIRRAVGTASALGLIIAVPGSIGFIAAGIGEPLRPPASIGYVNLIGFALIVPLTMRMAPVGARLAHTINPRRLRFAFAIFLAATSARMFYDLLS
ncbi:sulfite exporter TauE/SafE family protein [Spiribacter halobius]|uniref:Probable membrane transporter protein n=1 Tax=Sediminicurvatus halobius TaxID=2182432 RepID=A0A2U2N718_9GAMM|nr:sulfite exporter TauE/SafE family protein [Spiribacter halobius]PWG64882.1 hypothetical protein DEM34_03545 [Spiribacter halobius]UEX78263.1 sulfite exporter TauE/SafE family protein [Spiribacter halobius]